MADFNSLNAQIDALAAQVVTDSITPSGLASILRDILNAAGTLDSEQKAYIDRRIKEVADGYNELVTDEVGDRDQADKEILKKVDVNTANITELNQMIASQNFIEMCPALKGISDTVDTQSDKINDHEDRITDHEARIAENTLMRDNLLPLDELVDIPESSSLFTDGFGMSADKVVWNTSAKRLWGWNSTTNHYYSSWPTWRMYGTKAGAGVKGVIPAANRILYVASNPARLYVKSNTAGLEQLHEATVNRTLANYNQLQSHARRLTAVEEVADQGRTKANAVYEDTKGARFININSFADVSEPFTSMTSALECVPVVYRWHYGTVVTFLYEGPLDVAGKIRNVRAWVSYQWTATDNDEDADWLHTDEWRRVPDSTMFGALLSRCDIQADSIASLTEQLEQTKTDLKTLTNAFKELSERYGIDHPTQN